MAEKQIWIEYDLGIQGEYSQLYAWLDERNAVQCGDSLAFLTFNYPSGDDFIDALTKSLTETVLAKDKYKLYVIYSDNGNPVGRYIFGWRSAPVWAGYSGRHKGDLDVASS